MSSVIWKCGNNDLNVVRKCSKMGRMDVFHVLKCLDSDGGFGKCDG